MLTLYTFWERFEWKWTSTFLLKFDKKKISLLNDYNMKYIKINLPLVFYATFTENRWILYDYYTIYNLWIDWKKGILKKNKSIYVLNFNVF